MVTLEPLACCAQPESLRLAVESALRATFRLRIPGALVAPETLPRFELEARRWLRE